MRRVEIRDPINAEQHHLAVNHELPMQIFPCPPQQSTDTDRSSCNRPGDQPHPIAVTLDAEAETVVLDFVALLRPGRNFIPVGGKTELKGLKHAAKICVKIEGEARRLVPVGRSEAQPQASKFRGKRALKLN
jgi:hypothetical protein